MVRDTLRKHYVGMNKEFRFRGEEPSRIEALSDAGFAIAIGLLLISSTSPQNFTELLAFTKDVIPFSMCITTIMLVWYQHFMFFLRYGLRNSAVVVLNTMLLFIILFYVYPLKFLMKMLTGIYGALLGRVFGMETNIVKTLSGMISGNDMPKLMTIYGLGAAGIFLVLMFMYRYAYKKADELALNKIEIFDTRASIYTNLLMASIPLLSVFLILVIPNLALASSISGFSYFLYFPVMTIFGKQVTKKRNQLLALENGEKS